MRRVRFIPLCASDRRLEDISPRNFRRNEPASRTLSAATFGLIIRRGRCNQGNESHGSRQANEQHLRITKEAMKASQASIGRMILVGISFLQLDISPLEWLLEVVVSCVL